ncbi:hypothetical protein TcWFU_005502 [Taenia crassiceps]|uniref:Uncharacterized protein n=1 Tax=Taenia crassiceps TaxID=6207 RepID=A0ABR4Q6C3_9CEST
MVAAFALIVLVTISLTEARIDPCMLPIEPGLCRARFLRWGYDQHLVILWEARNMPSVFKTSVTKARNL